MQLDAHYKCTWLCFMNSVCAKTKSAKMLFWILCCQRRKAQARCIGLARSLGASRKKSVGFF
ncbi:hypothetical protein Hdeb2414_s0086g00785371 [Helianthus debilis subsp. tardiflorus]